MPELDEELSKYSRYFRPIKEDCQSLSLSPDITTATYTRSPTTPCTPVKIKLKKLYHLSKTTKNESTASKTNNGIKYVDLLTPPPKRFKLDSSPQFNIEDIEVKIPDDIRGNDINNAHLNPLTKDKAIIAQQLKDGGHILFQNEVVFGLDVETFIEHDNK